MTTTAFVALGLMFGLSMAAGSAIHLYREHKDRTLCPICRKRPCIHGNKDRRGPLFAFLMACAVFGGVSLVWLIAGFILAGGGAP
jgi:hypothetical protein